jgi:uncharacterized membrane protein YsdA (DUF1294 family)
MMMTMMYFEFFLILYALLNGCVLVAYARDKQKAGTNAWRTPENVLLVYALAGPFGAYAGIQVFRHKTRKWKFYLVPVFVLVHSAVIIIICVHFLQ